MFRLAYLQPRRCTRSLTHSARTLALTLALAAAAATAEAVPTVGFVEDFPGIATSGWAGGAITDNPGTGGFHGAGDGFLRVATVAPGNLGAVSFGAEYAGDWTTSGVTQVRCWLNDIGGTGNLEIHLSLSNGFQTWQHNAGLVPPAGSWGLYVVNIVESDFTHIRGVGSTFTAVLQTVDRLHFRHDVAPYGATPDPIIGSFGLDHLLLTNGITAVPAGGFGAQPVLLEPPYPNPARGRVTFQIRQPEPRPVRITILDAAGRRVRDLTLDAVGSAPRLWMWDGNDDQSQPVASGVYRVLARGENGGTSRTVTLIR